jgi:hypothetical protein
MRYARIILFCLVLVYSDCFQNFVYRVPNGEALFLEDFPKILSFSVCSAPSRRPILRPVVYNGPIGESSARACLLANCGRRREQRR